jgi:hypothetical protein
MAQTRLLYHSENGDRWFLVRDAGGIWPHVRHVPNAASGGRASDIPIAEFLKTGVYGPEHTALLRLIGNLVEGHSDA